MYAYDRAVDSESLPKLSGTLMRTIRRRNVASSEKASPKQARVAVGSWSSSRTTQNAYRFSWAQMRWFTLNYIIRLIVLWDNMLPQNMARYIEAHNFLFFDILISILSFKRIEWFLPARLKASYQCYPIRHRIEYFVLSAIYLTQCSITNALF